jgi:flagellar basal body-associated protein FliL
MKRLGAIISLTLLIVMLTTSFAFASTLDLEKSYPNDGDGGFQIENTGVKLYFNENVLNKDNEAINNKAIQILNSEGKKMPIKTYYSTKEKGLVLVLIEGMLETNTEYTLKVSEEFISANNDPLSKPIKITFKTRDTSKDMIVNIIMMGMMMVGVLFISSRNMKKQEAKKQEEYVKEQKVNPYKVSKETGKSVEEVVQKNAKDKEKKARKELKESANKDKTNGVEEKTQVVDKGPNFYKVKSPKPISLAGSNYKTGRKAKAEEAAAKEAAAKKAGTTRPKNQSGKSKNKKK